MKKYLWSIFALFVLLALYGCDVGYSANGETAVYTEQNWMRDASNPVVTGNGTTILQMSDPVVIYDNGSLIMPFQVIYNHCFYRYCSNQVDRICGENVFFGENQ